MNFCLYLGHGEVSSEQQVDSEARPGGGVLCKPIVSAVSHVVSDRPLGGDSEPDCRGYDATCQVLRTPRHHHKEVGYN